MNKCTRLFNLLLVFILLTGAFTGCSRDSGDTEKATPIAIESITAGEPVEVATGTIKTGGGTVTIDKPESPINGLVVQVPAGAYAGDTRFDISYSPIQSHILGDEVVSVSPLISIENGGEYAEEFLLVTVPATIPEDHFAMAFYYDEKTGNLEGIPSVRQDGKSLTLVTRHFSIFTLFAIEKEKLNHLEIDTGFTLGRDDWNMCNAGSYMSPDGFCQGMCQTAIWYYTSEKPLTGQTLREKNDNGLGKGKETPYFWQDDWWAIRLCSAVQENSTNMTHKLLDDFVEKQYGFRPGRTPIRENFYMLAFSLYLSQKLHDEDPTRIVSPQMIGVYGILGANKQVGHAVICYKLKDNVLYIADPNMPGTPNPFTPTITYNDGDGQADGWFSSYSSAQNTRQKDAGENTSYTAVRFCGVTSFDDMQEIRDMWTQAENGRCLTDDPNELCFPDYKLEVLMEDKDWSLSSFEIDPKESFTLHENNRLAIMVKGPFKMDSLHFFDFNDVQKYEGAMKKDPNDTNIKYPSEIKFEDYKFKEGDNLLGVCVMAVTKEIRRSNRIIYEWSWAGFDWINIRYEPREVEKAEIDLSRFTACSIELENIEATMRLPGGKEDVGKITPTKSNTGSCWGKGSFSGNVFTSKWVERKSGSSATATGSISVTIDPATMNITGFILENNTHDEWQGDWAISLENKPGINIKTDLEFFEKHSPNKLTYRVSGAKVSDYINSDSFIYKWTPGGDKWRECTGFNCTGDTVLTITFVTD